MRTLIVHRYFFLPAKNIVLLVVSFLLFDFKLCYSQAIDTLSYAKELNQQSKFIEAEVFLKPYYDAHPGNLNVQWLYAQTTYYAKHFKASQSVYENAIQWHPENYTLRLDYAKKLVDIGELEKAIPILNLYLTYDSVASDAHEALAKIFFWKAEYEAALSETDKVLKTQPNNKPVQDLRNKILTAKSLWLQLSVSYSFDDQPLNTINSGIKAGMSLHPLANLQFGFSSPVFIYDKKFYNAQWFNAGDKMVFNKSKIELNIFGGIVRLPSNDISGLADVQLSKNFAQHGTLSLQMEHVPYLYTRASVNNPLMQLHYSFAAASLNINKWQGKATFDINHFYTDNNLIYTSGTWIVSPPVKALVFNFRFGYGYNFSTSKENRFSSSKAITGNETNTSVYGVYDPYFTPNQQQVHSAIVSVNMRHKKIIDAGIKGNICFYGTTQNPYLYLEKDALNHIVVVKGFSKLLFFPVEASAYIMVQFTSKVSLKGEYVFMKNNFYRNQYIGLSLKTSFWNDKETK